MFLISVSVCKINYAASKANAPYFNVIYGPQFCTNSFLIFSSTAPSFLKKLNGGRMFQFPVRSISDTFLTPRRTQHTAHSTSCTLVFTQRTKIS